MSGITDRLLARRSVSFTDSVEFVQALKLQAASRGLTASSMVKMLAHDYMKKSPANTVKHKYEAAVLELNDVTAEYRALVAKYGELDHSEQSGTSEAQDSLSQDEEKGHQ